MRCPFTLSLLRKSLHHRRGTLVALLFSLLLPAAFAQAQPSVFLSDTLVAVAPSSNNSGGGLSGVRDYNLQVLAPVAGSGSNTPVWQTVKSVTGNTSEWVLYARFPAVSSVTGVRIQIIKINNGRWFDDSGAYQFTSSSQSRTIGSAQRATLYEFEAYGPAGQQ